MANLASNESEQGLHFATALRIFAKDQAPDAYAEALVQKVATRLQLHYGTSRRLKKAKITTYLRSDDAGESVSVRELVEVFHWHTDLIKKVLDEMVSDGDLETIVQQTVNPGPRGGRPATRYRLRSR